MNTSPVHQNKLIGASFGLRFAARLIDLVIHYGAWLAAVFVTAIALGIYAGITKGSANDLINIITAPSGFAFSAAALGYVAYHTFSEGFYGTSPGKRLLGLAVVKPDGSACRVPAALGRSLAFYVDGLFFGLVAYASMNPPSRQRLGDRWAQTLVVKRANLPPQHEPTNNFGQALAVAAVADSACYIVYASVRLAA